MGVLDFLFSKKKATVTPLTPTILRKWTTIRMAAQKGKQVPDFESAFVGIMFSVCGFMSDEDVVRSEKSLFINARKYRTDTVLWELTYFYRFFIMYWVEQNNIRDHVKLVEKMLNYFHTLEKYAFDEPVGTEDFVQRLGRSTERAGHYYRNLKAGGSIEEAVPHLVSFIIYAAEKKTNANTLADAQQVNSLDTHMVQVLVDIWYRTMFPAGIDIMRTYINWKEEGKAIGWG